MKILAGLALVGSLTASVAAAQSRNSSDTIAVPPHPTTLAHLRSVGFEIFQVVGGPNLTLVLKHPTGLLYFCRLVEFKDTIRPVYAANDCKMLAQ